MPFDSDKFASKEYDRANIEASKVPNPGVIEKDPAFLIQRADISKDWTGVITSQYILGSVALKPYLDPISARLDEVEVGLFGALTEEVDPIATQQVTDLKKVVESLPAAPNIEPLKTDIKKITDQYADLDKSKADQADLDAANAAIKALQDALAALPPSGATPAQLQAVDDRVKALENAISKAENSKGILNFDPRSHALIGGNLLGGFRRLTQSDITGINERAEFASTRPYAALNGSGTTDLSNASNQWLTWNFNQVRLWRVEISVTNSGGWINRDLKRNAIKILDVSGNAGSYTDVYVPKTVSGNELANSLQFVDDGGNTLITNLYVSVTDSANPSLPPTINGVQLKVGDRFRLNNGELSTLFTYGGTDAATGAWKATPVSASSDNDLARYSVINPIIEQHRIAIEALEIKNAEQETLILDLTTRITALEALIIKTDGPPPDGDWAIAVDCRKTATNRTTRLWVQCEPGLAIPLTYREDAIVTPTHSTAQIQPDGSFKQTLGDLKLNYKTTLNLQNEQEMTMTFAAGSLTRVDFEGQNSAEVALELGGVAIAPTATSLSLNPGCSNALVTQILWKLTHTNGPTVEYLIPLAR